MTAFAETTSKQQTAVVHLAGDEELHDEHDDQEDEERAKRANLPYEQRDMSAAASENSASISKKPGSQC